MVLFFVLVPLFSPGIFLPTPLSVYIPGLGLGDIEAAFYDLRVELQTASCLTNVQNRHPIITSPEDATSELDLHSIPLMQNVKYRKAVKTTFSVYW